MHDSAKIARTYMLYSIAARCVSPELSLGKHDRPSEKTIISDRYMRELNAPHIELLPMTTRSSSVQQVTGCYVHPKIACGPGGSIK